MSFKRKIIRKRNQQMRVRDKKMRTLFSHLKRRNWLRHRWLNILQRRSIWLTDDKQMQTQQELFN